MNLPSALIGQLASDTSGFLTVEGARVHNLKNLSVQIPHGKFVVLTGVSGCGKSSLAFDTIFAEGQRQYLEGLTSYARSFLRNMPRPDVDCVQGLQPTVALDQRNRNASSRSTVGTVTEIYDHLRLLFARFGVLHCGRCGNPIVKSSPEQIRAEILQLPQGTRVMMLAPVLVEQNSDLKNTIRKIAKAGFQRVRMDGVCCDVGAVSPLDTKKVNRIEAVIDRLIVKEGIQSRLDESLQFAIKMGEGHVLVLYEKSHESKENQSDWADLYFSTKYDCPQCGIVYSEVEPRLFSFNSPFGMCLTCEGRGVLDTEKENSLCPVCGGSRLNSQARSVLFQGMRINEIGAWSAKRVLAFFQDLHRTQEKTVASHEIVAQIVKRLQFLNEIGLDYLSLDRPTDTLSGGEWQRIRLASVLGAGLVGTCTILDEPSTGLHPRDIDKLIRAITTLKNQGNTVLVVEHDPAMMWAADWIIDMGPGAGKYGGEIVAQYAPQEIFEENATRYDTSLTWRYLSKQKSDSLSVNRKHRKKKGELVLENVSTHNLKDVTVSFPLETLICVTGVSGSGKSSLIVDTLIPAVQDQLFPLEKSRGGVYQRITGIQQIDRLLEVDQALLTRSPRSNAATASGVFDEIRKIFAATKMAKQRGYKASRFSFNAAGGRCETCQGLGVQKIDMPLMGDIYATCPVCHGQRFNKQTLEVTFKEKNMADVLEMAIDDALAFFENVPKIAAILHPLQEVGLGYLALGQPATMLSGGEMQRIKLATELAKMTERAKTLYVFDEPTSGLHVSDIQKLLDIFSRLVDHGNTVIVIEHHLDVMKAADWIIDLGPEGGERGGEILAQGTLEDIAAMQGNATGAALRAFLT